MDDRGHFYKPIQPGPRGDRERAFYESILAAKSRDKAAWDQGRWSPAAIAAVQAIASGQQIAHVLGLDKHHLSSNNSDVTGDATRNSLPAGVTSPTLSTSRLAPLRDNPPGSPRCTYPSGPIPFPSSPTYFRPSANITTGATTNPSTSSGMKHFPTFRAEPSFRHHPGGRGAIIRDPIEVLERDEVGLIDQLVEEEWLPWSEDNEEEEEEEEEEEGGTSGAKRKTWSLESVEGIPIPLVRNEPLGNGTENAIGTHHHSAHARVANGDGDIDTADIHENGSLRYSRSPDSASDDGLESNTGQHVMDGVVVAHSNSLRNQHSGRRSSLELMEAALRTRGAHRTSADSGAHEGHTTTTTNIITTTNTNTINSTASRTKFIGNTPTRPLGAQRSSTGMSHKSTDSIDEALRLHALSLHASNPPPSPFGGVSSSQPPILEEKKEQEENNYDDNSTIQRKHTQSASSSLTPCTWHGMPFTVRNAPLLRVIPKFYGVTHADDRTLLELEDLARWYRHPCIMDIKIGYKTWYTHAEPDYIERCKRKDATTTQASLGFKICGMQVYRHARGGYWRASKRWCKTLPEALVDKALASFANNEHGLRPADVYGGDQGVVAQLRALESWFKVQKEFHLFSASLLLLYEGDAHGPEETNVRVRLVDFAHTFAVGGNSDDGGAENKSHSEGDIDENFLGGLRAIASRLNAVSTMEYVADTLMTTAGG